FRYETRCREPTQLMRNADSNAPLKLMDAGALTFDWRPITMSHVRVSSVAPGWRTAAPVVVHDVIFDKGPPGWRAFVLVRRAFCLTRVPILHANNRRRRSQV